VAGLLSRRSPLLPIFLIVLVDIMGMTIVLPLLAIYAESFGATAFQAALLVPTFAVCQLVSGPLLGRISDRTGRRAMLLVSQLGTFAGFILMAKATSLWMLYLARVIDGSTAGNLSLAQAYISDNTEPKDRTKAFALIGIAFGLGFIIGPGLTAYLTVYGLSAPIYLAAGLSFLSAVCTYVLLPRGAKPPEAARPVDGPGGQRLSVFEWRAYGDHFRRPVLGGLLLQFLAYMLAFWTFQSGFALFAERAFTWKEHPFSPREIGTLFTYAGVLGVLLQGGLIGRLSARVGESKLVAWGFGALGLGYLILGPARAIPQLVVATTISSFGNAVLRPTLTSLVTQAADKKEQGVVLGLTQSLSSVCAIGAPFMAGFLIDRGLLWEWAAVAVFAAVAGLVLARWGSARVVGLAVQRP